jgi:hypothetical protein
MHMPWPRTRLMGAYQRKFQKCGATRSKFRCGVCELLRSAGPNVLPEGFLVEARTHRERGGTLSAREPCGSDTLVRPVPIAPKSVATHS